MGLRDRSRRRHALHREYSAGPAVVADQGGISQFLPLRKDQKLLLEAGLAGYSSWQITDDSGSDARNPDVHDQVHAMGGQLGLTYVPWVAALNVRYFGEFAAQDRFQGQVFGVSVAKKF